MCSLLTFIIYSGDPLGDGGKRAKNKPAMKGRDGIVVRKRGKYSIRDNFTQRICRSVILTDNSIPYFRAVVKREMTNFGEISVRIMRSFPKGTHIATKKERSG